MRVIWKDSDPKTKIGQVLMYREHKVTGYGDGWITDIPGDNNIYFPRECALNAIDQALGGYGRNGKAERHALGIKIIGTKEGGSLCG